MKTIPYSKPFRVHVGISWSDYHALPGFHGPLQVRTKLIVMVCKGGVLIFDLANVLDHPLARPIVPLLPPIVQAMSRNRTVVETMNDYDRATYYLARW